jgi:CBS domain-containing protein
MQKQKASFIVLTDDNERLTGVFTEHDVMNAYVGTNLPGETMIGAIMNRRMNTTTPSTSLREVINVMGANRVSQLPVLENDKIKGILTVEAIWEHLGENFPDELLNLPPRCDTSSLLQNGG